MNTLRKDTHQSINILAFDTAGDEASLAVWSNGAIQSYTLPYGTGPHSQAARLLPAMQALLKSVSLDFQSFDVIATPRGPGSFTGIRLGLAVAQGLQFSTKATSFAPTTLQILALGAWREMTRHETLSPSLMDSILVTLSTKRDSFYTQVFDKSLGDVFPASIKNQEEIEEMLEENPRMRRIDHLSISSAENLIHLYFHFLTTGQDLPTLLDPYYLHDPEFVKQKLWSL